MRQKIISLIESLHLRVFGHEMSPTMRAFLNNLSWSFVGILTSAFILFVVNLIAGRILGPEGYGNYNLVVSIASFSAIIIAFGFENTAVKYISETDEKSRVRPLASNAIIAIIFISSLYLLLGGLLRNQISSWLSADRALIIFALAYSVVLTARNLMDSLTKAMKFFKRQAKIKIIESLIVLLFFVLFFFVFRFESYAFYIAAYSIGMVICSALYFYPIRNMLMKFDRKTFFSTLPYQKVTLWVSFIGISISTIDKFLIAKLLGPAELGLYSAYLMSSTVLIAQIILVVNNVFFPMVNAVDDKKQIVSKIDRMSGWIFLPSLIFTALISLLILKIFGSAYTINWVYILLVSIIAFGQIVTGLYGSVTSSSHSYFKFSAKLYYFKPLFIAGLYFLAYYLHQVNLISVFLIVISSYIYDIVNTKLTLKFAKSDAN